MSKYTEVNNTIKLFKSLCSTFNVDSKRVDSITKYLNVNAVPVENPVDFDKEYELIESEFILRLSGSLGKKITNIEFTDFSKLYLELPNKVYEVNLTLLDDNIKTYLIAAYLLSEVATDVGKFYSLKFYNKLFSGKLFIIYILKNLDTYK